MSYLNSKNILRERAELAAGNDVITLNVGLVASDNFCKAERDRVLPPNPNTVDLYRLPEIVSSVLSDLKELGFDVLRYRVADSATEPTLVVTVVHDRPEIVDDAYWMAVACKYAQDCVAVKHSKDLGKLVGEYAFSWGAFNPDYFITMGSPAI